MGELFQREWAVTVDRLRITGLDVAFKVEKSTKREPNKAEVRIWNLTRDQRRQLQELEQVRVKIEAGYQDNTFQVFQGDLRRATSERDGADWITSIEGDDGGRAYLTARIQRSYPPGTTVETVVRDCARALGVGSGNVRELTAGASLLGAGSTFPEGTVVSGDVSRELTRLLRSVGLRWSVQNGNLQILRRGEPLQTTAVRLSPSTGLIGVPQVNAEGGVTAVALLVPDLFPGRLVQFDTVDLSGGYRVEAVTYTGDTAADDWYATLECKRY